MAGWYPVVRCQQVSWQNLYREYFLNQPQGYRQNTMSMHIKAVEVWEPLAWISPTAIVTTRPIPIPSVNVPGEPKKQLLGPKLLGQCQPMGRFCQKSWIPHRNQSAGWGSRLSGPWILWPCGGRDRSQQPNSDPCQGIQLCRLYDCRRLPWMVQSRCRRSNAYIYQCQRKKLGSPSSWFSIHFQY